MRENVTDPDRQRRVQSGELPAETVIELVDALRHSIAAAGIEARSIEYALGASRVYEAEMAVERLKDRIADADRKLTLAIEKAVGLDESRFHGEASDV